MEEDTSTLQKTGHSYFALTLNAQALEQILSRQREGFQRHLNEGLAETRHYMGSLAEGLEHKIQLIAEGHDSLRQELGEIRDQLTNLQERVTRIEGYTVAIRDMATKNTQDFLVIRLDIEAIKADIAVIRHDLKEKAARDELAALESRVAELERTLGAR